MMTKFCVVTDSGKAGWAGGIKLLLDQREVGTAVLTGPLSFLAGSAATTAANNRGFEFPGFRDNQPLTTEAMKFLPGGVAVGIVLTEAYVATS